MTSIKQIKWVSLNSNSDKRGTLTVLDNQTLDSFTIQRMFYMHDIKMDRGGHSHIETDQFIIGIHGSFKGIFKTPTNTMEVTFNDPTKALHVPRMIFTEFENFTPDSVCLVVSNTIYDPAKSLRNWKDYLAYIHNNTTE